MIEFSAASLDAAMAVTALTATDLDEREKLLGGR